MDFTTGQYLQLLIGLILAIIIYCAAYILPYRIVVSFLILIIPFQLISSRFGDLNMVLTYIIGLALFFKKKIRLTNLWFSIFLIVLAYLLSMTQIIRPTIVDHLLYLIAMGANFLLFFIVMNFVTQSESPKYIFNLLIVLNILVILYCYTQLLIGFERFSVLGVQELSMEQNRSDQRLAGPFRSVGLTAEYLVIQILLLSYLFIHTSHKKKKYLLGGVIASNFAFLVATGNRGGFISLIFGGILFCYLFRKEIGIIKLAIHSLIAFVIFTLVSVVVITYTPFNLLYERLSNTKIEEGLPDTRKKLWPLAWEEIKKKPLLGHGPRLRMYNEEKRNIKGLKFMPYPHNLYLFILYTLGFVGLIAYSIFFSVIVLKLQRARRVIYGDLFLNGIPRLGILVMFVFLLDQMKIEFLRYQISDYQNYIFALFGILVGFAYKIEKKEYIDWKKQK